MFPSHQYKSVPLSKLKPAEYNPRTIDDSALDGLKESMTQFGNLQPIVWNKKTGNVVSGHQRLKVLLSEGVQDANCIVIDVDEVQERAINVSMNNPHIAGRFERDGLADLISSIQDHIDIEAINIDSLAHDFKLDLEPDEDVANVGDGAPDNYIIQYNIIFNDEIEQETWFKYLRWLKAKYPDSETISEKLVTHIHSVIDE